MFPQNPNLIGTTDNKTEPTMYPDQFISWLEAGRAAVLTTKNPVAMHYHLARLAPEHRNVIVHCTITGYAGTSLEPNTPSVDKALDGYYHLVELLGPDRVVLRLDPIVPTAKGILAPLAVIEKVKAQYNGEIPTRIRLSFLDNYSHIAKRAPAIAKALNEVYAGSFHAPTELRRSAYRLLSQAAGKAIDTCAEGLDNLDVPCVSERDAAILGVEAIKPVRKERRDCGCLEKFELMKPKARCTIGCAYCFVR